MNLQQILQEAMSHQAAGRLTQAKQLYLRALPHMRGHFGLLNNLGQVSYQLGDLPDALRCLEAAVKAAPTEALPRTGLGEIYRLSGRLDEAMEQLQQAIALNPKSATAFDNLGVVLLEKCLIHDAISAHRTAILLDAGYARELSNLGIALQAAGDTEAAIDAFRTAVRADPGNASIHSNLLYALNFTTTSTTREVFEEHLNWARRHADPLTAAQVPNATNRDTSRRIRIGYLSQDFRAHPVANFVLPVLENHDRDHFEVFAYGSVRQPDAITTRLRDATEHWREIFNVPDHHAAQRILEDRLDILVDVSGHTAENRLLVCARKPAPVLITSGGMGYANTTGMAAFDYFLSDPWVDPDPENDRNYAEAVLRLPDGFLCYDPLVDLPPVDTCPGDSVRQYTFGCFNNNAKYTPEVLDLWCNILKQLPQTSMMLSYRSFQDPQVRASYRLKFCERNIDPDRVTMCSFDRAGYLAAYNRIDIALDPFPFNGHTTTCDALIMGVPVIVLAGDRHAARVGISLLNAVDLGDLVAPSKTRYLETAIALASDRNRLERLHRELRSGVKKSNLMARERFARSLEQSYRDCLTNQR